MRGCGVPRADNLVLFQGLGRASARKICAATGVGPAVKIKDLTEDEVEAIIIRTAPWSKVQNEWRMRRLDMERRNSLNATAIETLAETLQSSTDDRIRKSQMRAWIREFKALNKEGVIVPELE